MTDEEKVALVLECFSKRDVVILQVAHMEAKHNAGEESRRCPTCIYLEDLYWLHTYGDD